jgi:predicted metal-dependent phosphoesterase TrpH
MRSHYDLHSHSTASDGVLPPGEVVARAAGQGVSHLAITDHDTVAGLEEASVAAQRHGLVLVPGVELSTDWSGRGLHVVGLGIDTAAPELLSGLSTLQAIRRERAQRMDRSLRARRIEGILEDAQALAGEAMVTRTHFARAMVQRGYGASVDKVFRHYLRRGKPGYARVEWPAMEEVVGWIRTAGGVAVLAHPFAYGLTRAWLRRICAAFAAAGGQAVEVCTGTASGNTVAAAAALARRFDLAASQGSDFHDPSLPWVELGRFQPLPDDLTPVWRLLSQQG